MKKLFILLTAVGVMFTACTEGDSLEDNYDNPTEQPSGGNEDDNGNDNGDDTDDGNGDQGGEEIPDDAYISLNKDILTFAPDGESVDVKVYCNYEWTLTNNCDWVTTSVSGGEASEEGTIITLTTDLTYDDHEGTIIFSCGKAKKVLVVSQSFKEAIIADDSNTLNIPAEGGIATIAYQTTIDCEVIIPEDAKEWITIAPATRGLVSESANLNVAENTTYSTRTAVVKVVAKDNSELFAEYTINQEQKDGLLVDGDNVFNLDFHENTITIKHKTNVDCEVIIPEEAKEWITIAPATRGLVSESINLNVAENTTYSARTAVVKVVAKDNSELFAEYTINQNRGFLIVYTSSDGNIVTPRDADAFNATVLSNTYENGVGIIVFDSPITSIGSQAFYGCTSLTSITIPDSVTSIGNSAFYYCSSLTSVTIPDSVTSIGDNAFSGCTGELIINSNCFGLFGGKFTKLTIGDSVTKIRDFAFSGCSSLTSVTIGNGVTSIGSFAFDGCSSLKSITIPDSVTSIGDRAFYDCSLTSVTIPDSVTSIGNNAFSHCYSLTSFYGKFASGDNRCLIVKGVLKFFAPAKLTSYTIPDNVTSIGDKAFDNCRSLTSITIPESVTSIGEDAFHECTSLTSITIPDRVTSIGSDAFDRCTSLKEVYCKATIPPILSSSYEFSSNASGRKIYVPKASVEVYKTDANWSGLSIEGYDF